MAVTLKYEDQKNSLKVNEIKRNPRHLESESLDEIETATKNLVDKALNTERLFSLTNITEIYTRITGSALNDKVDIQSSNPVLPNHFSGDIFYKNIGFIIRASRCSISFQILVICALIAIEIVKFRIRKENKLVQKSEASASNDAPEGGN